jgi:hypothetical protein
MNSLIKPTEGDEDGDDDGDNEPLEAEDELPAFGDP